MIKLFNYTASFLIVICLFSSCNKVPNASFVTDKAIYNAGETIVLTNTSTDSHHYIWTFPNNQTTDEKNTTYLIPDTISGLVSFKLEAFSRKGDKTDEVIRTVNVLPKIGSAMFWKSENFDDITVNFYGPQQHISENFASAPACGNSNCANFTDIPIGTYTYDATDGVFSWTGELEILENTCSKKQISYADATE